MCGGGPNCVVYPDDDWSHGTDLAALRRFLDVHLAEVLGDDAHAEPHANSTESNDADR
jgi:(2Fe-2S) ferredoxin